MNRSPSVSAYRRTPEPRPRYGRMCAAMLAAIVVTYFAVIGVVTMLAAWTV